MRVICDRVRWERCNGIFITNIIADGETNLIEQCRVHNIVWLQQWVCIAHHALINVQRDRSRQVKNNWKFQTAFSHKGNILSRFFWLLSVLRRCISRIKDVNKMQALTFLGKRMRLVPSDVGRRLCSHNNVRDGSVKVSKRSRRFCLNWKMSQIFRTPQF